jgi:hypothetical protein
MNFYLEEEKSCKSITHTIRCIRAMPRMKSCRAIVQKRKTMKHVWAHIPVHIPLTRKTCKDRETIAVTDFALCFLRLNNIVLTCFGTNNKVATPPSPQNFHTAINYRLVVWRLSEYNVVLFAENFIRRPIPARRGWSRHEFPERKSELLLYVSASGKIISVVVWP